MQNLEDIVLDLQFAGVTTDLLVTQAEDGATLAGVRLRTFGRKLPKNRMVLGAGPTFREAMEVALDKAESGRWETLEWATRPWPNAVAGNPVGRFGFD